MATAPPVVPYVHQSYPCVRYHPAHGPRKVKDPAEEAALGDGWVDSPAKLSAVVPEAWRPSVVHVADGLCPTCRQAWPVAVVPDVTPAPTPELPVSPDASPSREAALEAEARESLFKMTVTGLQAVITTIDDVAMLGRIRGREALHPKHEGGRKGVLDAIDARVGVLTGVIAQGPTAEPEPEPVAT